MDDRAPTPTEVLGARDALLARVRERRGDVTGNGDEDLDGACRFVLGGEADFTLHLGEESRLSPEPDPRSACLMTLGTAAFVALVRGDADPVELFYGGRVAIRGDVQFALRVANLIADPEEPGESR